MNDYLVTYDGGQDVYADDLSFMQNSLKSMIDSAVRTYGENCILYGCLDSSKENVVEGGVVISGKLYQVPALGPIGLNKLCFRETLSSERKFEDGSSHKVKKSYEAYLSEDTSEAFAYVDLKEIKNVSQWAVEEYKKDVSILVDESVKEKGWFGEDAWSVKVPGGRIIFIKLNHRKLSSTSGSYSISIGKLEGIELNNDAVISTSLIMKTKYIPAIVSINKKNSVSQKQVIQVVVPSDTDENGVWYGDAGQINENFVLQFNFFDSDIQVTNSVWDTEF